MAAQLAKGQNAPIAAPEILVSMQFDALSDVSALLVTANGNVRTDADFVFFNQPVGAGVRLVDGVTGQPQSVAVTFTDVPADIDQVRIVLTLDDPSSTFGRSAAPVARISDRNGSVLYQYVVEGLSNESVVIALEAYRRQSTWKIRAVGQGYAGGFADLVSDHGVSVDDEPSTVTPPPAPTWSPTTGSSPTQAGATGLQSTPSMGLSRGQAVSLKNQNGVPVTSIQLEVGWESVRHGRGGVTEAPLSLDVSAVLFNGWHVLDVVYFGQLNSKEGSIRHGGNSTIDAGEVVDLDLDRIHPSVSTVILVVTSSDGRGFADVENAFTRIVDRPATNELSSFTLAGGFPETGLVMSKVYRHGHEWTFQAIGEGIPATHVGEAVRQLSRFL